MLFYEVLGEFNVILDDIDYIIMGLSIVNLIVLIVGILLFLSKYKQKKLPYFFWITLVFIFFSLFRLFRLIQKYYVGKPPLNDPYEGAAYFTQIISIMSIIFAYFSLYCYLEKTSIKKTHYIMSILTLVGGSVTIITLNIRTPEYIAIYTFFGTILISGIPLMYLILAFKSSGKVRINALIIAIAFLFIGLGIIFDGSTSSSLENWISGLPELLVAFTPPIVFLIGWFLLIIGFRRES